MTRQEMIDRGATQEEIDLLCPKCGCSVMRISMGIIDFACLGYYDPSDKSFHDGGEACKTIAFLRNKISTMERE